MCLTHTTLRYEGCGHKETTLYHCDERMNLQLCPHHLNFVDESSAHQCRNCVEEEARCQEEEARRQELVAAGLAQAARAAEAFNRRMYAEPNGFGPHGEPGQGAAAPGHDSDGRQQQDEYQQLANAGLAQAARAADALRRRVLSECNFDIPYEGCDGRFTPFSGTESDNGNDGDDDDDEMWSPGSPSDSSTNLVTPDASIPNDTNRNKLNDEADFDCSHHSNHRSESASFYDHAFEESSSEEPPSSDDGQFSEVGGVSLGPTIVYRGSPSCFEESSASSPGMDKQGKLDEEDVVCDFRLGIFFMKRMTVNRRRGRDAK